MKIEKINEKTIQVLLTSEDMDAFDLTYEQMDAHDLATKEALLQIIGMVQQQTEFALDSHKIFIEAFPRECGGCLLYVNLVTREAKEHLSKRAGYSFDTPLVFRLHTLDTLLLLCQRLWREYQYLILKTAVYHEQTDYLLLLYTYCKMEDKLRCVVSEYGDYVGKGNVLAARIQEYAHPVLTDHAVETLLRYLQ